MITRSVYLGNGTRVLMHLVTGTTIVALVSNPDVDPAGEWPPGAAVTCHLPATALRVLSGPPSAAPAAPGA